MIYEFPPVAAPIRQGDIFVGLPRFAFSGVTRPGAM